MKRIGTRRWLTALLLLLSIAAVGGARGRESKHLKTRHI